MSVDGADANKSRDGRMCRVALIRRLDVVTYEVSGSLMVKPTGLFSQSREAGLLFAWRCALFNSSGG